MPKLNINLRDYRSNPAQRSWDLPSWGHALSKCVLPLFIQSEGYLHPIGTAFWIGPGVQFIATAMHNIREAFRFEPRLERLLTTDEMPSSANFKNVGFSVLHQGDTNGTNAHFSFIPLQTINAGPPGDVAFGHPQFENGRPILSLPLSFAPPRIGETVWSVGYTDFEPKEGISISALMDGSFNFGRDYRHRFVVTEGQVERIFTQRMFNKPTSLSSMLYPLLLNPIDFGATIGSSNFTLNMKASRTLLDLVLNQVIFSDGSEKHVAFHQLEDGQGWAVGPSIPAEDRSFVHEDFRGFEDGRPAARIEGEFHQLRRAD